MSLPFPNFHIDKIITNKGKIAHLGLVGNNSTNPRVEAVNTDDQYDTLIFRLPLGCSMGNIYNNYTFSPQPPFYSYKDCRNKLYHNIDIAQADPTA